MMPQQGGNTNQMEGIAMSKASLLGIGSAVVAVTVVVLSSAFIAGPAAANPGFAAQTGKPCGACHVNPAGGGKLTGAGEKFKASNGK
jgi:hypothetical protein